VADVIGNPSIRAEFDSRALLQGAKDAGAKLKTTFEESNRNVEAVQRKSTARIQGLISQLNAEKPRRQMFELGQAVQHMGGMAALSEQQVAKLRVQVERLTAAGAKAPKSLAGLTPVPGAGGGGALGAALTSLGSGGGIAGALGAIGPAGIIAATSIGIATAATMKATAAVKELASQAEHWSNVSEATGLSVESVQKLGDFLEDAGFQAEDLSVIMKKMQVEIAGGGKAFEKYGINIAEIKRLAPEEQLRAIAAAVTSIVDPTERAAAAQEFFGKQGAAKLAALRGIAAGTYSELHAMSVEQIADLKRVDDQLDEAGRSWENWKKRALASMIDVASFSTRLGENIRRDFQTQFGDLGNAPNVGDTRRGRVFQAPGLVVPKGPSDAELEAERQGNERRDRADAALIAKKEQLADLLAKAAESARKLAFKLISDAPGGPTTKFQGVDTIAGGRSFGMGTMVGAKNFDFGIDAQGFVTWGTAAKDAGEKAKGATTEAKDWGASLGTLADQLNVLAQTTGGLAGKIVGFAASLSSGLGGALSGFQQMTQKGGPGGILGFLGKASGALGAVGSIVGVGISLFKGIKGLFGGKSKEEKAAEAAAKKQAAEQARAAQVELAQKKYAAAEQAKTFAESLNEKIAAGGLSEKLGGALSAFVGKLGDALGKFGLGVTDARLKDSASFQAASGVAGDVAGGLRAASEAGILDTGITAAATGAAAAIQEQAIAAAREAGLSDMEAAKQGSLAIAQILREQLNASIRSGTELDEGTKALLEEAKKNGIEIMADPMIESLGVQKDQLAVLRTIAGKGRGDGSVPAAKGLGPVRMPNMGGGLGPLIQTHAGEMALILPASMSRGGLLHAARGIYDDDYGGGGRGGRGDSPDSGGPASPAAEEASAIAESVAAVVAELRAAVLDRPEPTVINNPVSVQIVDESAVKTAEGQRAFGRFVVAEVERALDQNSRGLTTKVEEIARRAAR